MIIPPEFFVFGGVLAGVAVFHRRALPIAAVGLAALLILKGCAGFPLRPHLRAEAPLLIDLIGLLLGFAALARHFEDSHLPALAPRVLPSGWAGPFALILMTALLSVFLDNIAAVLVAGTVASTAFRGRVHIAYLAALVAAANAGGAGSVLGDTTTTMMWLAGVPAAQAMRAFIGSAAALLCFGIPAARAQHRTQPLARAVAGESATRVDGKRLLAAALPLLGALGANLAWGHPAAGVWAALLLCAPFADLPVRAALRALPGAAFLACLVSSASLLPVEKLPAASTATALALGFVSAFFDNIPLTKLALDQGGYDWGLLAYCVGFGGSMLWFGSSAGVALSDRFPEIRSVRAWLRGAWPLVAAYLVGFAALALSGTPPKSPIP